MLGEKERVFVSAVMQLLCERSRLPLLLIPAAGSVAEWKCAGCFWDLVAALQLLRGAFSSVLSISKGGVMSLSSLQRDAVCKGEEMSLVQCFLNEAVNDKCYSFAPTGWNVQPRSPIGHGRAGFLFCCKGKTEVVECQRDRKDRGHILPISYLSICPIFFFSLDLCKLVFTSITGIYFPH